MNDALAVPHRLAGLDGLRGLCVLCVFAEHFVCKGLGLGGLGVSLFFALSGYLIVAILHRMRHQVETGSITAWQSLRRFWINRMLRIFPIYYLVLMGLALFHTRTEPTGPGGFQGLAYYFVFLGNYYIQYVGQAWGEFTHLWSLCVEQHFYMLVSPLLLWQPAYRHQSLVWALLGLALASQIHSGLSWSQTTAPTVGSLSNFTCITCGALLALGIPLMRRISQNASTLLTLVALFLYFASFGVLGDWLAPGCCLVIGNLALLALCAGLLSGILNFPGSAFTRFLEWPGLKQLGTVSYGFYLYHYLFPDFEYLFARFGLPDLPLLACLIQFVTTWALATLSWHLVESPLLRLKPRALTP